LHTHKTCATHITHSTRLSAHEALAAGLVSRVVSNPLAEAISIAQTIAASTSGPAAARAKAALRAADALPLHAGLLRERELFYGCFGPDQKEGMAAFAEKRAPAFREGKPGSG
jgi:enoyl-CoA hydratase